MSYDLPGLASETAVRQLRRLSPDIWKRIANALRVLEDDSFRARPKADVRILEGTEPRKCRIRVGDYRAVYSVAGQEVRVIEVFVRGRGYR
jgi:mRNA-degrading endonuclease RelE of RelBE toxin-antitoxin system